MPGRPFENEFKKLLIDGILHIYGHKKSAVKGAF
jgi:ssRNA-specific RNase YbeY (16S rRNA maturation enzyme)